MAAHDGASGKHDPRPGNARTLCRPLLGGVEQRGDGCGSGLLLRNVVEHKGGSGVGLFRIGLGKL